MKMTAPIMANRSSHLDKDMISTHWCNGIIKTSSSDPEGSLISQTVLFKVWRGPSITCMSIVLKIKKNPANSLLPINSWVPPINYLGNDPETTDNHPNPPGTAKDSNRISRDTLAKPLVLRISRRYSSISLEIWMETKILKAYLIWVIAMINHITLNLVNKMSSRWHRWGH